MRFRAILANWMFLGIFTNFLARKLFNAIITIKHAFLMLKHLQGPYGEFQHLSRGLADVDAEITNLCLENRGNKWNKQPATDLCDRMVILSTSFGHNNDLFQDTELKKIIY